MSLSAVAIRNQRKRQKESNSHLQSQIKSSTPEASIIPLAVSVNSVVAILPTTREISKTLVSNDLQKSVGFTRSRKSSLVSSLDEVKSLTHEDIKA